MMLYTKKTFDFEWPLKEADVWILGIPWDSTSTGRPTRYGPVLIREAIKGLIGFDTKMQFNPLKLKFCDLGDVDIVQGDWAITEERIIETIKEAREQSSGLPVFFGGDHLVTLAIIKALKPKTVVHMDAHRDMLPDWMGNKFAHLTWAWHASKMCDVYQPSCRAWNEEERPAIVGLPKKGPVYLTIDLDVLDPSIAPDVGTPEPAGLGYTDMLNMIKRICRLGIIGFDIVECSADKVGCITACTAANLFKKILSYHFYEKGK
ncbi:MAG: arginase family protein [Candidatus Aenigmatarchaeota archaeon]